MSFNFWILTIPHASYTPYLPPQCTYIKGQLELSDSGFLHWQLVARFEKKVRLPRVRFVFGEFHAEPTRSANALDYVWKEDTRVLGTQFEIGSIPIKRSCHKDWDAIRGSAKRGDFESIPSDIFVRCYNQLRRIGADYMRADPIVRECYCYWGISGSGKSRRAWAEASFDAYPKDPNTKFWDGYNGHQHVVIDEFRGLISVNHLLRWLDRYPVLVEIKGSSVPLCCTKIWITSNLSPREWYSGLDDATVTALLRRLNVTEFTLPIRTTQNNVGAGAS